MMQPTDHTSISPWYFLLPSKTSGGLYHRVMTSWVYPFIGIVSYLASPKSAIFKMPLYMRIKYLVN